MKGLVAVFSVVPRTDLTGVGPARKGRKDKHREAQKSWLGGKLGSLTGKPQHPGSSECLLHGDEQGGGVIAYR